MGELKYITVNYVDSVELDRFIAEEYGRPFSAQRYGAWGEPCPQDTAIEFTLGDDYASELNGDGLGELFNNWLGSEIPKRGDWKARSDYDSKMPYVGTVMYDLYKEGKVPGGPWIVKVWW